MLLSLIRRKRTALVLGKYSAELKNGTSHSVMETANASHCTSIYCFWYCQFYWPVYLRWSTDIQYVSKELLEIDMHYKGLVSYQVQLVQTILNLPKPIRLVFVLYG